MTTQTQSSSLPESMPLDPMEIRLAALHTLAFLTDRQLTDWYKALVAEQAHHGHIPPAQPMDVATMRNPFYPEVDQAKIDDAKFGDVLALIHISDGDDPSDWPGVKGDTYDRSRLHQVLHKFGWTHK